MRGDRIKAICKVCGKTFDTPYALAEICDWVCRSEHMTRKARIKKGLPAVNTLRQECEWCGDDYFGLEGSGACSAVCRGEVES